MRFEVQLVAQTVISTFQNASLAAGLAGWRANVKTCTRHRNVLANFMAKMQNLGFLVRPSEIANSVGRLGPDLVAGIGFRHLFLNLSEQ